MAAQSIGMWIRSLDAPRLALVSLVFRVQLLCLNVSAEEVEQQRLQPPPVFELTTETFSEALREFPTALVQFYAPFCGHSNQLAPEYAKAAVALKDVALFARVNAHEEILLAEEFKISGYPTLYFFNNGRSSEYSGGRTNASIVKWVLEQIGPPVLVFKTPADLDKLLKQRRSTTSAFVAQGDSDLHDTFIKIAEQQPLLGAFYVLEDRQGDPCVSVYRGTNQKVTLSSKNREDMSYERVQRFLQEEVLPPWGEIGEENFDLYLAHAPTGMVWACLEPLTFRISAGNLAPVFEALVDSFPALRFVFFDAALYKNHAENKLGCERFPTIVVQLGNMTNYEDTNIKHYSMAFATDRDITEEVVSAWVQDVLDGTIEEDANDEDDEEDDKHVNDVAAA